jgi:beta-glucanase (GH16 family)
MYGYVEVRMQGMRGAGLYSSIWMMPSDFLYDALTSGRDSDFPDRRGTRGSYFSAYEMYAANINGSEPWRPAVGCLQGEGYGAGRRTQVSGIKHRDPAGTGTDFSDGFHVFGLEWTPFDLIWYVSQPAWPGGGGEEGADLT